MKSDDRQFDFDISAWPALPALPGVFVIGTDTDVGKTLIAGAIGRALLRSGSGAGRRVEVFKPVASGCRKTPGGLISEDAEFLAYAVDTHRSLAEITPVRYAEPLSPNVAAQRSGRPIDLDAIFCEYSAIAAGGCDAVVVEGVGGLLCPITDDFWVIHLAKMLALPVVIVAHAGLGTINHTQLTVYAARSAGLSVAGVIINRYQTEPKDSDAVIAMQTNPDQIANLGDVPILALVPDEPENSVANAKISEGTQFAIDQVNWQRVLKLKR